MEPSPAMEQSWLDLKPADASTRLRDQDFAALFTAATSGDDSAIRTFEKVFAARIRYDAAHVFENPKGLSLGGHPIFSPEDLAQYAFLYLVLGLRYQPVRARYVITRSPLLNWVGDQRCKPRTMVVACTRGYLFDLLRCEHRRRLGLRAPDEDLDSVPDPVSSAEERLTLAGWYEECRKHLPEAHAEAIRLKHLEGWSQKEIAERLGVAPSTIHEWLEHATRRLRECLERSDPELARRYASPGSVQQTNR